MSLGRKLHAKGVSAAWALFLLGFLAAGVSGWEGRPEQEIPAVAGPWASSDYLLQAAGASTAGPSPAQTLREALVGLPPDGPVLLVGRTDGQALWQIHYLISHLAWPRPVSVVACGLPPDELAWKKSTLASRRFAAVLLYQLPPPAAAQAVLEPILHLVPGRETSEWTSFCPP